MKIKKLLLIIACCLFSVVCINDNLKAASSTTVSGIYCFTQRTNNYTTFDAATTPNGSGYGGTYKLVSTGAYSTLVGGTPTQTYTVTGASEARISNKALPTSSAIKWTSVSSAHYYRSAASSSYGYLVTTNN